MVVHWLSRLKDGIEHVIACILNNHLILLRENYQEILLGRCFSLKTGFKSKQVKKMSQMKFLKGKLSCKKTFSLGILEY